MIFEVVKCDLIMSDIISKNHLDGFLRRPCGRTGCPSCGQLCNSVSALHCTALHCTALHCTALHCTALQTLQAAAVAGSTSLFCTVKLFLLKRLSIIADRTVLDKCTNLIGLNYCLERFVHKLGLLSLSRCNGNGSSCLNCIAMKAEVCNPV